jgi:hypothetical protein
LNQTIFANDYTGGAISFFHYISFPWTGGVWIVVS